MNDILFSVLALIASFFVGLLFNADKKSLLFCGLSGLFGYIFYIIILNTTNRIVFATFIGAVVISLFAEMMARLLKKPSTIFIITGIFPIVPGALAYNTVVSLASKNFSNMASLAFETLACAGGLAFGIMVISSAFSLLSKQK